MDIFKLFACCIPVKGAKNNIICDLQREEFINIPEALYEIITEYKDKSINEIKSNYEEENHKFIDEYFEYLIENEYGFWCDLNDLGNFPDLNLGFESPELINNAIIDIDENSKHNYKDIFEKLDKLKCKFIEIRFFNETHMKQLLELLNFTSGKIFRNIDIILKHSTQIEDELNTKEIYSKFPNLRVISVHSSPVNKELPNNNIYFYKNEVKSCNDCGKIEMEYFRLNIQTFSESQHFNTCLNKKISIDTSGNIKNCPALGPVYGNINDDNCLEEIIKSKEFTSWWEINKDKIDTCKDCEYRYICTDCRAFVDKIYDKPKKCTYNPYEGVWEN